MAATTGSDPEPITGRQEAAALGSVRPTVAPATQPPRAVNATGATIAAPVSPGATATAAPGRQPGSRDSVPLTARPVQATLSRPVAATPPVPTQHTTTTQAAGYVPAPEQKLGTAAETDGQWSTTVLPPVTTAAQPAVDTTVHTPATPQLAPAALMGRTAPSRERGAPTGSSDSAPAANGRIQTPAVGSRTASPWYTEVRSNPTTIAQPGQPVADVENHTTMSRAAQTAAREYQEQSDRATVEQNASPREQADSPTRETLKTVVPDFQQRRSGAGCLAPPRPAPERTPQAPARAD